MRLLFVAASLPVAGHSVRAQTVLVREAIRAFTEAGHELVFQPLIPETRGESEEQEQRALEWARAEGVELLPALHAPPDAVGTRPVLLLRQAMSTDPALFYPSYALREEMVRRVEDAGADIVFHLWCSAAHAACADVERPIFAYAGNPDHYSMAARLKHPALFDIPRRTLRNRAKLGLWGTAYERFERVVLRLTGTARWLGCVSAPNARFYSERGHPNAFYIQNMWPRLEPAAETGRVDPEQGKIVGNLGGQYATGNTFGLWFLGREILPELDRRLGDRYTVHLYGAGSLSPPVAEAVRHPRVVNRGFVDDIDAELRSARVFLLANNSNPDFVVGHTRILHAWSLDSCLVAHRNMALAMPEIVHGENALLGESGAEMAEHVAAALSDEELRRRIAEGGRRTWEEHFVPSVVVGRVLERISARPTAQPAQPAGAPRPNAARR